MAIKVSLRNIWHSWRASFNKGLVWNNTICVWRPSSCVAFDDCWTFYVRRSQRARSQSTGWNQQPRRRRLQVQWGNYDSFLPAALVNHRWNCTFNINIGSNDSVWYERATHSFDPTENHHQTLLLLLLSASSLGFPVHGLYSWVSRVLTIFTHSNFYILTESLNSLLRYTESYIPKIPTHSVFRYICSHAQDSHSDWIWIRIFYKQ